MFSLHPLSHLQNGSWEWRTPLWHFQVFNAIEVSFSCFILLFFCIRPSTFRQSLLNVTIFCSRYPQKGFTMFALRNRGAEGGEGAVNAELRRHWIPTAIALSYTAFLCLFPDSMTTRDQRQCIWAQSSVRKKESTCFLCSILDINLWVKWLQTHTYLGWASVFPEVNIGLQDL